MRIADREIFDKLDWYENDEVHAQARDRFAVLMKWLDAHGMLTDDGKSELEIPDDFVLYDGLLTEQGVLFLKDHYESWLFSGGTSDPIDTTQLDEAVR